MVEDEKLRAEFQALADNPTLRSVLEELEREAVEEMVNASVDDHNARAIAAIQVRTVRGVSAKIRSAIEQRRPQLRRV